MLLQVYRHLHRGSSSAPTEERPGPRAGVGAAGTALTDQAAAGASGGVRAAPLRALSPAELVSQDWHAVICKGHLRAAEEWWAHPGLQGAEAKPEGEAWPSCPTQPGRGRVAGRLTILEDEQLGVCTHGRAPPETTAWHTCVTGLGEP